MRRALADETGLEDILQVVCYGSALAGVLAVLALVICGVAAMVGVVCTVAALTAGAVLAGAALGFVGSLAIAVIVGFCRR